MTSILRQSTARTILFGPIVDSVDATVETAQTIVQADRQLSKEGAAFAQTTDTVNATHRRNGHYSCSLSATDTNTVGELVLEILKTGCAPYWKTFEVLPAQVFDARYVHPLIGQAIVYGQLQSGNATSGALPAAASATNDTYNGALCYAYGGAGAGQVAYVDDYVGSSRTMIFAEPLVTAFDATTLVAVLPFARISTVAAVSAAIGGAQLSGTLHAPGVRPTRDQALLYLERFFAHKVQATSTTDNVRDVNGTTNIATITYSPDNAAPTSHQRTA